MATLNTMLRSRLLCLLPRGPVDVSARNLIKYVPWRERPRPRGLLRLDHKLGRLGVVRVVAHLGVIPLTQVVDQDIRSLSA
jgi:hypothetical protein